MAGLFDDDDIISEDAGFEADAAAGMEGDVPEAETFTPRTMPDLLGHEAVEEALLGDFNAGRMPHAVILAGASGIGKATLAYRLARFLLAQSEEKSGAGLFGAAPEPESLYIAPDHPVFRRVASGGHADLLTVEREMDEKKGRLKTEISVETVRRIHPFLRKTAAEGGWRVVIVDSAECLNRSSQNALLKILEEPPAKTLLILTTSQPGAFLPTIRSRCRMVPMEALSETVILKLLERFAPALSANDKTALARLAEGSIGRALRFQAEKGLALYRDLLSVVEALPQLDIVRVHELAEKLGKAGSETAYETACEILSGWCMRQVRAQARGYTLQDILPGDAVIFRKWAEGYAPRHFLDTSDKLAQLFWQADQYNLDKRQILMNAFLMLQKPDYQGLNI